MSEKPPSDRDLTEPEESKGPNLILIYGLLAAAIVIAMTIAALIVLPFYHHH
jgi:hypothetical protein